MKKVTAQQLQLIPILGIVVTLQLAKVNHPSFIDKDWKFGLSSLLHAISILGLIILLK